MEHTDPAVARWAAGHPITVAFVTATTMLVLTVFLVQRALDAAASRRWRAPAHEALGMWLFAADDAARSSHEAIMSAAGDLDPQPPLTDAADGLEALARRAPDTLVEVSNVIRNHARQLAHATSEAAAIVPRCAELVPVTLKLFEDVSNLDQVADTCRGLAWVHPAIDQAGTLPREQAEQARERLVGVVRNATQLRLYVMESRTGDERT